MPQYKGDLTLSASVRDLDASIAWYVDVLGLELVFREDAMGWAELTTPTKDVTLGLGVNEEVHGAGGITPVLGVIDIEAAYAELQAKGVKCDGGIEDVPDMVRLVTFYDPDGNSYMYAQSLMG